MKTSREGDDFILRLYNPDSSVGDSLISGTDSKPLHIHYCDPSGDQSRPAGNRIELPGYGVATIRIENSEDHKY